MVDQVKVIRASALAGHYGIGKFGTLGADDTPGVILQELADLVLYQVAAWPDTVDQVGKQVADAIGADQAPAPCRSVSSPTGSALRVEPLKWWLCGIRAPDIDVERGTVLDISHSRTRLLITGPDAAEFLNRFLPLDLRESVFPVGSVASSVIHHVGVTLCMSEAGYELFIPRGFALSLWHLFVDVAKQFGLEVC